MKRVKSFFLGTCLLLSGGVLAADGQTDNADLAPPQEASQNWFQRSLDKATHKVEDIYHNGRTSLILSGYAYHSRRTYTPEKIHSFNEHAWGLGVSRELRNAKDNEESLAFLVLSDSHSKPQVNAVYTYQWMQPLGGHWEAGIGYMAGLFHRSDIFGGIPFPAALPLATMGTRDTKLVISYVPRLSGNKGNGNVLYFALRIALD